MKSKIRHLNGTAKEFDVQLSSERVKEVFDQVIDDIRKEAVLPGFRKGNAPLDLILKNYHKQAVDEVKQRLVPKAYQEALEEHQLNPVSLPELLDVVISPEWVLTFTARVEIYPDIKLVPYKKIKITREKVGVTDAEVEEAVEKIRNLYAEFNEVEEPVSKGDFAICDVEVFVDGKVVGKKHENIWIQAEKESSVFGLGEDLCGAGKGARKSLDVKLPEDYPDKNFAGKDAKFEIDIKSVRRKSLPPFDDELAKKMGKADLAELRSEIRSQLLENKETNGRVRMKSEIVEFLLKNHSFPLPESMVKRQLEVLTRRAEEDMLSKGLNEDMIKKQKEKMASFLASESENKVKVYFVLDRIAAAENITVGAEEIEGWIKDLADYYNQPYEKVKSYYEDNDLMGGVEEQIREEKTLDFLLTEAAVTEK